MTDKDCIRKIVTDAGACSVGFAEIGEVDDDDARLYSGWIEQGKHASMDYLDRYHQQRRDPAMLLDGARTLISCAFDYRQQCRHRLFADYALGEDYHDVIRRRLKVAAEEICAQFGGTARVCVDTAPVRERYWAARAGIGYTGRNGQLIVDGVGPKVFLAEILWTGIVEADASRLSETCVNCGKCVAACPGNALDGEGGVDARRCLSYLTIEHRGELPENMRLTGRLYGCDVCQDVCPHNKPLKGLLAVREFLPTEQIMELGVDDITKLDDDGFRSIFRHSAVRRAKLTGLLRNARHYKEVLSADRPGDKRCSEPTAKTSDTRSETCP